MHTAGRRRRRASAARRGALAVAAALCVLGSAKLFALATSAAGANAAVGGTADRSRVAALNAARRGVLASERAARDRAGGSDGARTPQAGGTASPSQSPPPASSAQVSGQSVTAVGDSIMVASTPALDQALPGIYIDAMVGRQFATGLQVIASLKASGQLRQIVVVGLGTNGPVTPQEISQLFAEIGPDRRLVLVNTFEARPWEQEVNSILTATVGDHPGVVLANWYQTIENHTDLLWPDGIHPQPGGAVLYAQMLKTALEQLLSQSG